MSDEDDQLQSQPEELPDDGQDPEDGEAGDVVETPPEETPAEPAKPEAEFLKEQVKTTRDRYSVAKKEADIGRQMLRDQEAEGLLDRDEAAAKLKMTRPQFDAYLDHKAAPEPGDDGHMDAVNRQMDEDYRNPSIQKALTRVYGAAEEQQELAKAFNYALADNPELKERFENVKPEDALYLVLDEGKAALEDFREAQTTGGSPRKLMAELRKLREENAALKSGRSETLIDKAPEGEPSTRQKDDSDPLAARDARLRALQR